MEEFPFDLGTIYTKYILLESTLKTKNQVRTNNNNTPKHTKKKKF